MQQICWNTITKDSSSPVNKGASIHVRHISKTCFLLTSELAAFRVTVSLQSSPFLLCPAVLARYQLQRGLHCHWAMTLVSKACFRGQWVRGNSQKWFTYLLAYTLSFSLPHPYTQHHLQYWWWFTGWSCSLTYLKQDSNTARVICNAS